MDETPGCQAILRTVPCKCPPSEGADSALRPRNLTRSWLVSVRNVTDLKSKQKASQVQVNCKKRKKKSRRLATSVFDAPTKAKAFFIWERPLIF